MADNTTIGWANKNWDPITGCLQVSPGCAHCYAMRLAGTRRQHHPSRAGLTRPSYTGPVWTGEVLDPFGGAGTTGLVADRLGRQAVLIELNPAYAQMAHDRIVRPLPLLGALLNLETLSGGA